MPDGGGEKGRKRKERRVSQSVPFAFLFTYLAFLSAEARLNIGQESAQAVFASPLCPFRSTAPVRERETETERRAAKPFVIVVL